MKVKSLYRCTECRFESSKWLGRCPQCETWNSFALDEEVVMGGTKATKRSITAHAREPQNYPSLLLNPEDDARLPLDISEVDRVLGGGFVLGSLVLLTGEPGIGKSTLTLQIADRISTHGVEVLYNSGEESEKQIALRGKRLGMKLHTVSFLCETNIDVVIATAKENKTPFIIIDSIQVMYTEEAAGLPGSISQVRLCTEKLLTFAKKTKTTVLMIGHVTKDGTLAGPRVLEHLVDCVLYLEGSRHFDARLLRSVKNRFGSVSEIGVFEMSQNGLNPISNPAEIFVEHLDNLPPGAALTLTFEGTRPMLLEVQALTNKTNFGYPQRTAQGVSAKRLQLLIAVLEKYLNVPLGQYDVYINVVGGYTIQDPTADLAVCCAILSSLKQKSLPSKSLCIGEIGLTGEVRIPKKNSVILKESARLGMQTLVKKSMHVKELTKLLGA